MNQQQAMRAYLKAKKGCSDEELASPLSIGCQICYYTCRLEGTPYESIGKGVVLDFWVDHDDCGTPSEIEAMEQKIIKDLRALLYGYPEAPVPEGLDEHSYLCGYNQCSTDLTDEGRADVAPQTVVDYRDIVMKCVRGGTDWKGYLAGQAPGWLETYLASTSYTTMEEALQGFLHDILAKEWTFQKYLEAWGQGYMCLQFSMWLDDPVSLSTYAKYLADWLK